MLLAGLIAFVVIGGCGSKPEQRAEERSEPEYDFADYRAFVEKTTEAGRVDVYEGLPSDFDEPELYAAELAKKIHVSIDGFKFYNGAKKLTELQAAVMNGQLRTARHSLRRAEGMRGIPSRLYGRSGRWE